MSTTSWLQARETGVPQALRQRISESLGDEGTGETPEGLSVGESARTMPEQFLGAARQLLAKTLDARPMSRAQALDLLCADALVTYAFEAAAEDPGQLPARADRAMAEIAALAMEDE